MPPPDTPVMQVNRPSGSSAVTFLRLLPRAFTTLMVRRRLGARRSGTAMVRTPVRYWPVSDFLFAMMSAGVPVGDDLAAMDAGAGADIDHMVGDADGVLVMLDHDHGIAEVAQALEGLQAAAHCRAGAGRWRARRARRARR